MFTKLFIRPDGTYRIVGHRSKPKTERPEPPDGFKTKSSD